MALSSSSLSRRRAKTPFCSRSFSNRASVSSTHSWTLFVARNVHHFRSKLGIRSFRVVQDVLHRFDVALRLVDEFAEPVVFATQFISLFVDDGEMINLLADLDVFAIRRLGLQHVVSASQMIQTLLAMSGIHHRRVRALLKDSQSHDERTVFIVQRRVLVERSRKMSSFL